MWLLASLPAVGYSTPAVHAAESTAGDASRIDFNQQIRPIFADYCFACHGPDEKKRKADLRLDTQQGAFAELDDHFAIAPARVHPCIVASTLGHRSADAPWPDPMSTLAFYLITPHGILI